MRFLVLSQLPALALGVEVEAAKLVTADAMPVEAGSIEVAASVSWMRSRSAFDACCKAQDRSGTADVRSVSLGLTGGLVEDLDAGITAGFSRISDGAADPDAGSGLNDVVVGAKWRFFSEENLAVTLIPTVSLPVGDGRPAEKISTGSNLWEAALTLACSASIDRLAIGAALSRGWITGEPQDRGDARGCLGADLACGWQLTGMVQPEIELHYVRRLNVGDTVDSWAVTTTAGVLIATDYGRFGAGCDQVVAGKSVDRTTSVVVQWVMGF